MRFRILSLLGFSVIIGAFVGFVHASVMGPIIMTHEVPGVVIADSVVYEHESETSIFVDDAFVTKSGWGVTSVRFVARWEGAKLVPLVVLYHEHVGVIHNERIEDKVVQHRFEFTELSAEQRELWLSRYRELAAASRGILGPVTTTVLFLCLKRVLDFYTNKCYY